MGGDQKISPIYKQYTLGLEDVSPRAAEHFVGGARDGGQ